MSARSVIFLAVLLPLVTVDGAQAMSGIERANCKAKWARDTDLLHYCIRRQVNARNTLEKLWRKVGHRPEAASIWRRCKLESPGAVSGHDWEMMSYCVNARLGPARLEREALELKYGVETTRTRKGVWHIIGRRAYGPNGDVCEYRNCQLICQ